VEEAMLWTRVVRCAAAARGPRAPSWVSSSGSRFPPPVGLLPDENARNTLIDLYRATFVALQEVPAEARYRINVEKTISHRMKLVEQTEDVLELEEKLGLGKIEEVIEQAKDELQLVPFMVEHAPWKGPDGSTKTESDVKLELID